MNKIEKIVYDIVKSNPKVKLFIRNIYQAFFDILPGKKEYSVAPIDFKEGYFFGFHDLQPFSRTNDKLLANKLYLDLKMPAKNDYIDVGYFRLNNGGLEDFIKLGESNAWNYHKGCRLQWLNSEEVIFNTTYEGRMVSKIVDINNSSSRIVNFPIDSVSPNAKWATSFSYERLERYMPGYGYNHSDSSSFIDEKKIKRDGIVFSGFDFWRTKTSG